MGKPLVSIICLNYNQALYLMEAVDSVIKQTYPDIELIIVDDASTDNSLEIMGIISADHPEIQIIKNEKNIGNCRSFNRGLKACGGEYIIDLAADDVLMPERVEIGVENFKKLPDNYGVHFSDAEYVDRNGHFIRYHYRRNRKGHLKENVPQGNIYPYLLERYLICTPTMMIKREVFEELGGYNEGISYEDFDFWVRSSKKWYYAFSDMVLVKKRMLEGSFSTMQYMPGSAFLESTYKVCLMAENMNETERDRIALVRRVRYELRQTILINNLVLAEGFLGILNRNDKNHFMKFLFRSWLQVKKMKFSGGYLHR